MKRFIAILALLVFLPITSAFGSKYYADYYTDLKNYEISSYYTNLVKWFSVAEKMRKKDILTKPDQSEFKTHVRLLLNCVSSAIEYSGDASAEFWALVFDADNKELTGDAKETYESIINTIVDERDEYNLRIKSISDSFDSQYKVTFEDNQISDSEYRGFLSNICALNDIIQEILIKDAQYEPEKSPTSSGGKTSTESKATRSSSVDKQKEWGRNFESAVKSRMKEYYDTKLDDFHLCCSGEGDSISSMNIYFTWSAKNGEEKTKKMLQMFSDDLSATLHNKYPDIPIERLTIFWRVPYLSEIGYAAKYQYKSKGDKVYLQNTLGFLYGKD